MRSIVNLIAILAAIAAVALALNLLVGFSTGYFDPTTGPSTATMQWSALVTAGVAIAFGFFGRIQDRRMPRPASKLSDGSIAAGLLSGLLVFALPYVFG